jgi:NagD protein
MMRAARKELQLAASETIMIGDTMETDILGGVQLGYYTILVLSGSTRREDLDRYGYRPELVVDSVADLCSGSQLADIRTSSSTEDDTPLDLRQWALTHGA